MATTLEIDPRGDVILQFSGEEIKDGFCTMCGACKCMNCMKWGRPDDDEDEDDEDEDDEDEDDEDEDDEDEDDEDEDDEDEDDEDEDDEDEDDEDEDDDEEVMNVDMDEDESAALEASAAVNNFEEFDKKLFDKHVTTEFTRPGFGQPCKHSQLLVSSAVLSLASPFFAKLFHGPMAEGLAFRAIDSPRPFIQILPEDSCHTLTIIANILHHQAQRLPEALSSEEHLSVAILADKYDMRYALRSQASMLLGFALRSRRHDYNTLEAKCRLMIFAYVFGLAPEFYRLSWDILMMHHASIEYEQRGIMLLPHVLSSPPIHHDLKGAMLRQKILLRSAWTEQLQWPVNKIYTKLRRPNAGNAPSSSTPAYQPCEKVSTALTAYFMLLDAHDLLPGSRQSMHPAAFENMLDSATKAATGQMINLVFQVKKCGKAGCACSHLDSKDCVNLAHHLKRAAELFRKRKFGVCLDCLKNGQVQKWNDKECRIVHFP